MLDRLYTTAEFLDILDDVKGRILEMDEDEEFDVEGRTLDQWLNLFDDLMFEGSDKEDV
jgi:hypothetical protein